MTDADADPDGTGDGTVSRTDAQPPPPPDERPGSAGERGSANGLDTERGSANGLDTERDATTRPVYAPPDDDSFDWRGWSLVALVFACFLVIPGAILLLPGAGSSLGSLGLSLRDAYLTLPLIPAILLGAVAVWSAVASRRE